MGLAGTFHLLRGLNFHFLDFPVVPTFQGNPLVLQFTEAPWNSIGYVPLEVYFGAIGIAYLLTREVSLSFWAFYLAFGVLRVGATQLGYPVSSLPRDSYTGSPSLLCAAIASARGGAKIALVHDRPVLGGNASSEVRLWICGAHGKIRPDFGGGARHFARRRAAPRPPAHKSDYEPEMSLQNLQIEFASGAIGLQIGPRGEHSQFYADVFGETGRAKVGMYLEPCAFDLDNNPIELPLMPPRASPFKAAYEQIAAHLNGGILPDCTNAAFVAVNEIGFASIESAHQNGTRIALPGLNRSRKIWADG